LLLICDHASFHIPDDLAGLGLPQAEQRRHIGWDIGAAAVTRRLAELLDAQAVLGGVSRLVIDLNRHPNDADAIPELSDGTVIPANMKLGQAERERRVARFFTPYHKAIAAGIESLLLRGPPPALIAVHSFTPSMRGTPRPWHVGILWNRDSRLADPLIASLAREPGLIAGDNEPYSGRSIAYSMNTHAGARGLPHAGIEIRQDLIEDEAGVESWAQRLAGALSPLLTPELLRAEFFLEDPGS
jgi:predicted N-formylglutamate amidohydrolase